MPPGIIGGSRRLWRDVPRTPWIGRRRGLLFLLVGRGEVFPGALAAFGGEDVVQPAGGGDADRSQGLAVTAALRPVRDEVGAGAQGERVVAVALESTSTAIIG